MQILTAKIFGVLFIVWFLCGCGIITYYPTPEREEFYRLREVPYTEDYYNCSWKAQHYYYFLIAQGWDKEKVRYVKGKYYDWDNDKEMGHAWVEVKFKQWEILDPTFKGHRGCYQGEKYNEFPKTKTYRKGDVFIISLPPDFFEKEKNK